MVFYQCSFNAILITVISTGLIKSLIQVDGFQVTQQALKTTRRQLARTSHRMPGYGLNLQAVNGQAQEKVMMTAPATTTTQQDVQDSGEENGWPIVVEGRDLEALFELVVPLLAPFTAFFSYEYVAQLFSASVEAFSNNSWYAVDGGALQAKIIAPAINGLVVPSIALLFATLTSTTISTLRQRQVDIRKSINLEAGELRNLCQLVHSYHKGKVRDRCRAFLLKYTKRILKECLPHVSDGEHVVDPRRGMETELNDFLIQLNREYDQDVPAHLASESFVAIAKLREHRLNRITALQSTYPVLHWATLGALAFALCTCFLMETNQDLLFFLNAFQLKILWAMVVGTFTYCGILFFDLLSPFGGSYQISASVDQLHTIRKSLALKTFDKDAAQV